ncbi:unnamed protein product [Penicillium discolor]
MSPKKTWFLPPDFTFLENGLIKLGTVIAHPKHPTLVLLDPDGVSTTPPIKLPPVQVLVEPNHIHTDNRSNSIGGEIWGKFVELASVSLKLDIEWGKDMQYGVVDHEVHSFVRPFTRDTLAAIVAQPSVRKHMDDGLWGKQPVYIVSGLRITKTEMSVTNGQGTTHGGGIGGSGPVPAGVMPVEVGVDLRGEMRRDKVHSYETAPGIIFAYRLNVIRQRRGRDMESEIFSHKTAFMTGGIEEEEEMEMVDIDTLELKNDLEDEDEAFSEHSVGNTDYLLQMATAWAH